MNIEFFLTLFFVCVQNRIEFNFWDWSLTVLILSSSSSSALWLAAAEWWDANAKDTIATWWNDCFKLHAPWLCHQHSWKLKQMKQLLNITACCIRSVISSSSNLNPWSSTLGLFYHVPLQRDQGDWDWRLRSNDTPNAIGLAELFNFVHTTGNIFCILQSWLAKFGSFPKICCCFES